MGDKLKAKFLPTHDPEDNDLKLHDLKQGYQSGAEHDREFE